MNIVYVSVDPGIPVFSDKGAAVHVREFAGALADAGHRVTVISTGPGSSRPGHRRFDVEEIERPRGETGGRGPGQTTTAASDARSRELALLGMNQRIVDALVARHRSEPIDFVYERYSLWSVAGAVFSRLSGVPLVLEVNSPLVWEQARYRSLVLTEEARWVEHTAFDTAHRIVAVSSEVAEYVASRIQRPDKIRILPNGVDLSLYRSLAMPPVREPSAADPRERFTVGFLGSLKPWHGLDVLVQAFAELAGEDRSYRLLIVGDGPARKMVERTSVDGGFESAVTLTGSVEKRRVPSELARMDVAVAPYPRLAGFYFSPLKLFDYMAAGRPIVASRIGQIVSILEDGRNGLLADPGDPADLARKIRMLRAWPDLAARLGASARRDAFARHGWEHHVKAIVDDIARAGAGREPRAAAALRGRPMVAAAGVGAARYGHPMPAAASVGAAWCGRPTHEPG
jgi:glycosyltransferase involved in cell wall biosynthesis